MITEQQQRDIDISVARLAAVSEQITELQQQERALKSFIRLALGPGTHAAGDMKVSIIPRQLFDASLAATVVPPEILPLITVTEEHLSGKLAKEFLPEGLFIACCRPTTSAVRLT